MAFCLKAISPVYKNKNLYLELILSKKCKILFLNISISLFSKYESMKFMKFIIVSHENCLEQNTWILVVVSRCFGNFCQKY